HHRVQPPVFEAHHHLATLEPGTVEEEQDRDPDLGDPAQRVSRATGGREERRHHDRDHDRHDERVDAEPAQDFHPPIAPDPRNPPDDRLAAVTEQGDADEQDLDASGWRPRALRDGQEPDPRFTLANERTFLAWIRTSLGLVAGAVALEAFAGDEIPAIVRPPVACILLVLAALLAVVSFRRWIRIEVSMRHKQPLPVP